MRGRLLVVEVRPVGGQRGEEEGSTHWKKGKKSEGRKEIMARNKSVKQEERHYPAGFWKKVRK